MAEEAAFFTPLPTRPMGRRGRGQSLLKEAGGREGRRYSHLLRHEKAKTDGEREARIVTWLKVIAQKFVLVAS